MNEASKTSAPSLICMGHHVGKPPIALARPVTLVGSRHNAHLHLLSRQVSKAHALIVNSDNQVYIHDLASRTHVYVNEVETEETVLGDGDVIQIGSFSFRFAAGTGRSAGRARKIPPAQLVVDEAAQVVAVVKRVVLIGRRPTCDVPLLDPAVSTAHAVVFEMNGRHYVRDLGSRTGTFVNDQSVRQAELKLGDHLRIGPSEIIYRAADEETVAQGAADDFLAELDLLGEGKKPSVARAASDELLPLDDSSRAPAKPVPASAHRPLSAQEPPARRIEPEEPVAVEQPLAVEAAAPQPLEVGSPAPKIDQPPPQEPPQSPLRDEVSLATADQQLLVDANLFKEKLSSSATYADLGEAARDAIESASRQEEPQPNAAQATEQIAAMLPVQEEPGAAPGPAEQVPAPPVQSELAQASAADAPAAEVGAEPVTEPAPEPQAAPAVQSVAQISATAAPEPTAPVPTEEAAQDKQQEVSATAGLDLPGIDLTEIDLAEEIKSVPPPVPTAGAFAIDRATETPLEELLDIDDEAPRAAGIVKRSGRPAKKEQPVELARPLVAPPPVPATPVEAAIEPELKFDLGAQELAPLAQDESLAAPEPAAAEDATAAEAPKEAPSEVVEETRPTTDSALGVEDELSIDEAAPQAAPSTAAAEPSDTTVGRQIKDLAGTAFGQIVEVPPDEPPPQPQAQAQPPAAESEARPQPPASALPSRTVEVASSARRGFADMADSGAFAPSAAPAHQPAEPKPAPPPAGPAPGVFVFGEQQAGYFGGLPVDLRSAPMVPPVKVVFDKNTRGLPGEIDISTRLPPPAAMRDAVLGRSAPPIARPTRPVAAPQEPVAPAAPAEAQPPAPAQTVEEAVEPAQGTAQPPSEAQPSAQAAPDESAGQAATDAAEPTAQPVEAVAAEPIESAPATGRLPPRPVLRPAEPSAPVDDAGFAEMVDDPEAQENEAVMADPFSHGVATVDAADVLPTEPTASDAREREPDEEPPAPLPMFPSEAGRPGGRRPRGAPRQFVPPRVEASASVTVGERYVWRQRRRRRMAIILGVLVVLLALAALAIWKLILPKVAVWGTIEFDNFAALGADKQQSLETGLKQLLSSEESVGIRTSAVKILDVDAPGTSAGFLSDVEQYARKLNASEPFRRGIDPSRATRAAWVIRFEGADEAGDRARLLALVKAIHLHPTLQSLADSSRRDRKEFEDAARRLAHAESSIRLWEEEASKIKASDVEVAHLKELRKSREHRLQMEVAARQKLESELARLALGGGESAATTPATMPADPQLLELELKLAKLNRSIAAQGDSARQSAAEAKAKLDLATGEFQNSLANAQRLVQGNAQLAAYVAAAQDLLKAARKLAGDVLDRQRRNQELLVDLKRELDDAMEAQRQRLWASDEKLNQLQQQLALVTRQHNAAVADNLPEAAALKVRVDDLSGQIAVRRKTLGEDSINTRLSGLLKERIDEVKRQVAEDARQIEQTMQDLEAAFAASAPAVEQLPGEQRQLAERLKQQMEAMAAARRAYADITVAPSDEVTLELRRQARQIEEQIASRSRMLADERLRTLDAGQHAALAARRDELKGRLAQAQQAERDAQAALSQANEDFWLAERDLARKKDLAAKADDARLGLPPLAATKSELEQKVAMAVSPLPPGEGSVQVRKDDPRSTYVMVLLAAGLVLALLMGVVLLVGGRELRVVEATPVAPGVDPADTSEPAPAEADVPQERPRMRLGA